MLAGEGFRCSAGITNEKALLLRALHQVQFNRTAAAALLGLNLRQIRYRMERLGIISNDKTDDNQPT